MWFDKLATNGDTRSQFALSLSKGVLGNFAVYYSPCLCCLMVRKANGNDEARISSKAGAAALAKKASEAAAQIDVARVSNPMGLKINVAGSSFMVSRNTNAAPAKMPGRTNGTVTVAAT